jgi:N-methylhydantoinase A/oxoprolinase/acetone carboxylase beta subunit
VYDLDLLEENTKFEGPAIIINKTSTIVVEFGWIVIITDKKNVLIKKQEINNLQQNYEIP